MFNHKTLALIVVSAITTSAFAQDIQANPQAQSSAPPVVASAPPVSPPVTLPISSGLSIREIIQITERNAILAQQLKQIETEVQIASKRNELNRYSGGADGGPDLPNVKGIVGMDGVLQATLIWAGGVERTVKKGDRIRGGWTVKQIDVNSVSLQGKGKNIKLGFGNEPPAGDNSGRPNFPR